MVVIPEPEASCLEHDLKKSTAQGWFHNPISQEHFPELDPMLLDLDQDKDAELQLAPEDSYLEGRPLNQELYDYRYNEGPVNKLKQISFRFASSSDMIPADEFIQVFGELCATVQQLLHASQKQEASTGSSMDPTYRLCCIASAVFVLTPLRNVFPDPSLLINDLVHKLRKGLAVAVTAEQSLPSSLQLWLLCVGLAASTPLPADHRWFLGRLLVLLEDLHVTTWAELRGYLMEMMWNTVYCEGIYIKTWEEAQQHREYLAW